ncbi:MAG: transposase [Dehalococcoidia bacterium]|nr:transposase [Dehalococcoidia bacterium]
MPNWDFAKPIRLPREAYSDRDRAFHVVIRALPGQSPFRGDAGQLVWDALLRERDRSSITLLAACLLPDHLHILVRPGDVLLFRWVQSFKSFTTALRRHADERAFSWQPRFYDRAVRAGELWTVIRYITGNPVEARLVAEGDEWPWVWVSPELG